MKVYDVIIVGAGPVGITMGIECEKKELSYLILEKGALVNSIYHFPTNMTFFSTSKLLEIGNIPFISHSEKPTRRESLEYFRRVHEAWNLKVHCYETVTAVHKDAADIFSVVTNQATYKAQKVVVCTGFYDHARQLNIPGEHLPKVRHYYDEPHPYIGQKVVVVGAANSACDVALELFHKGAKVTMVVRKPTINDRVKYWILPNIQNRIKEGSISSYFNSHLVEVTEHHVTIKTPKGNVEIENDFVLAMTGYLPNYDLFDQLGINYSKDEAKIPHHNPDTLESNVSGLYLAGVIISGMQTSKLFIENTKHHAEIIVSHLMQSINKPLYS